MSPQLWWYAARATGYVAWALVSASVVFGLLVSTRLARGRLSPAWALDLHRFLGGASVVFTALHLAGLVADSYVHFGPADLLVPLASSWKPGPVALGVVALYLLAAVQGTSMMMRRLPRRLWRAVHLCGYAVFWLASFHLLAAGTDAANPWSRAAVDLVVALVVFLSLVRALSGRPARGGRASARPPSRAASPAPR